MNGFCGPVMTRTFCLAAIRRKSKHRRRELEPHVMDLMKHAMSSERVRLLSVGTGSSASILARVAETSEAAHRAGRALNRYQ
jgi:hypothetical protein